jgi:hypothetical protein
VLRIRSHTNREMTLRYTKELKTRVCMQSPTLPVLRTFRVEQMEDE